MTQQAKTDGDLELVRALRDVHVARYSDARLEIERITQIGVNDPKKLMTVSMDGMDNQKVCMPFHILIKNSHFLSDVSS